MQKETNDDIPIGALCITLELHFELQLVGRDRHASNDFFIELSHNRVVTVPYCNHIKAILTLIYLYIKHSTWCRCLLSLNFWGRYSFQL